MKMNYRATTIIGLIHNGVVAMAGDGVNVYVIHPRDIPQPFAEADWPMRAAALEGRAGKQPDISTWGCVGNWRRRTGLGVQLRAGTHHDRWTGQ